MVLVGRRSQLAAKHAGQPKGGLLQEDQVEVEPKHRQAQPQAAIFKGAEPPEAGTPQAHIEVQIPRIAPYWGNDPT